MDVVVVLIFFYESHLWSIFHIRKTALRMLLQIFTCAPSLAAANEIVPDLAPISETKGKELEVESGVLPLLPLAKTQPLFFLAKSVKK